MLSQFARPIMERQKARFPGYIAKLEAIATAPDPRRTAFLTLAAIMAHDLRNELTVIAVTLELEDCKAPSSAGIAVLPA